MPERTLAFDLDGTLVDARRRQVELARHVVREVAGAELDERAFWRRKRAGATTRDALRTLGVPAAEAAAAEWARLVEDPGWVALDAPLPGARATLARVRAAGLEPLVLTARRDPEGARVSLDTLGLPDLRLVVVSPEAAAQRKARRLAASGALAFVGDTESDAAAARAAGIRFVAVACGQRSARVLRRAGCQTVASSPAGAWAALAAGLSGASPR